MPGPATSLYHDIYDFLYQVDLDQRRPDSIGANNGYVGRNALQIAHAAPSARPTVDIVSGATVTVSVIGDSIIRSAIAVAHAKGLDAAP